MNTMLNLRILRGGNWGKDEDALYLASRARSGYPATSYDNNLVFRCAKLSPNKIHRSLTIRQSAWGDAPLYERTTTRDWAVGGTRITYTNLRCWKTR